MKNIILVILLLTVFVLLAILINLYQKSNKYTKSFEEEKYSRMVAEESLQKNAAKIVTLEAQLNLANSKMEKIQDLIDQQKGMNEDLKKEYNKLNEVKIDLETRLQSVLKAQSTQEPVAGVAPLQEPVEVSK